MFQEQLDDFPNTDARSVAWINGQGRDPITQFQIYIIESVMDFKCHSAYSYGFLRSIDDYN